MKNRLQKIIILICAILVTACAASLRAAAEGATPTDLSSVVSPGNDPEEPAGEEEPPADSVEIVITKSMQPGQSWEGRIRNMKPVILKLDVEKAQTIHMIVEGKNVCASVRKADRPEENPRTSVTDPQTRLSVVSWNAEAGSYLITVNPDENCLLVRAKVTFLDEEGYKAWEEQNTGVAGEDREDSNPDDKTEDSGEAEEPEFTLPENRSVHIDLRWETDDPQIGDVAHFDSVITGYEDIAYSLQWQTSRDADTWTDYAGATGPRLDVVLTEETDGVYFRLVVYVESEREDA